MVRKLKNLLKKTPLFKVYTALHMYANMNARLKYLEARVHNDNWYMIEKIFQYLVIAEIPGEYCEFGVFKGTSFRHALRYHGLFPAMKFFAFDSFQGLPAPTGIDNENGYASNFYEGQFACGKDQFAANITEKGLPLDKVIMVEGWFDVSLTDAMAQQHKLDKIAVASIDCDFYESTVPVLDFIKPRLSVGSVIVFDDWKAYRNLEDKGQQKACAEWLEKNPTLKLNYLFDYGVFGRVFSVAQL